MRQLYSPQYHGDNLGAGPQFPTTISHSIMHFWITGKLKSIDPRLYLWWYPVLLSMVPPAISSHGIYTNNIQSTAPPECLWLFTLRYS
jgi:hypothetical protein